MRGRGCASGFDGRGSKALRSRQPARHLSQNAAAPTCLPSVAIKYIVCATLLLASVAPRSSSSRKYLRSVLGERISSIFAISCWRLPMAAKFLTSRRCSSVGVSRGRGMMDLLHNLHDVLLLSDRSFDRWLPGWLAYP